jgi:hypothetical protein
METEKNVKTTVEVEWDDDDRLKAARAGVQLRDEYVLDMPLHSPLLDGIDRDGNGVLSVDAWRFLRAAIVRTCGADLDRALAAATEAYVAAMNEEEAARQKRAATEAAAKEKERKIAEARELLRDELAKQLETFTYLRERVDTLAAENKRIAKLALFIQSRGLEADFYAADKGQSAAARFAADFHITARE